MLLGVLGAPATAAAAFPKGPYVSLEVIPAASTSALESRYARGTVIDAAGLDALSSRCPVDRGPYVLTVLHAFTKPGDPQAPMRITVSDDKDAASFQGADTFQLCGAYPERDLAIIQVFERGGVREKRTLVEEDVATEDVPNVKLGPLTGLKLKQMHSCGVAHGAGCGSWFAPPSSVEAAAAGIKFTPTGTPLSGGKADLRGYSGAALLSGTSVAGTIVLEDGDQASYIAMPASRKALNRKSLADDDRRWPEPALTKAGADHVTAESIRGRLADALGNGCHSLVAAEAESIRWSANGLSHHFKPERKPLRSVLVRLEALADPAELGSCSIASTESLQAALASYREALAFERRASLFRTLDSLELTSVDLRKDGHDTMSTEAIDEALQSKLTISESQPGKAIRDCAQRGPSLDFTALEYRFTVVTIPISTTIIVDPLTARVACHLVAFGPDGTQRAPAHLREELETEFSKTPAKRTSPQRMFDALQFAGVIPKDQEWPVHSERMDSIWRAFAPSLGERSWTDNVGHLREQLSGVVDALLVPGSEEVLDTVRLFAVHKGWGGDEQQSTPEQLTILDSMRERFELTGSAAPLAEFAPTAEERGLCAGKQANDECSENPNRVCSQVTGGAELACPLESGLWSLSRDFNALQQRLRDALTLEDCTDACARRAAKSFAILQLRRKLEEPWATAVGGYVASLNLIGAKIVRTASDKVRQAVKKKAP